MKLVPMALCLGAATITQTGCSLFQHRREAMDDSAPAEETVRQVSDAKPGEPPKPNPLDEMKNQVNALHARVEDLEGRLSSTNDKLEATRISLEAYTKTTKRAGSDAAPVIGHPADLAGVKVEPKAVADDPEAGFINDDAVQAYRRSMVLFQSQKYPEAVLSFSNFLERYPDHPFAGSAQFYVGEAYFKQREYSLAAQEFQRVITTYDRSPQISESLRDLADSEDALKKRDQAAHHRQLLTSLFPQSPAATRPARPAAVVAPTNVPTFHENAKPASHGAANGAGSDAALMDEPPPTAPIAAPQPREGHK